jgi:putative membrane protein
MHITAKLSCLTLSVMALIWSPLTLAQTTNDDSSPQNKAGSDTLVAPKSTSAGSVSKADRKFYDQLAQANVDEIEAAKVALSKSDNAKVKDFAQQMIDDHGAALKEVSAAAALKNIEVPSVPDAKHQKNIDRMQNLSLIDLNSQYAQAAVDDHRATLNLLNKIQAKAKDQDLKALAQKMAPTVQDHLNMAMNLTAGSSH